MKRSDLTAPDLVCLGRLQDAAVIAAALIVAACGGSQPAASVSASSSSPSAVASQPAATATPSPSNVGTTLYVLSPEHGAHVGGTVQITNGSDGTTLTAKITGLSPNATYLADADPLPCELFVDGPSQSFAARFTADGNGKATVAWTVPSGMAGNANVQSLTQGTFVVVACADLG